MTLKEVLEKMKGLILAHGWVQGFMGDHQDGFCLLGAQREAQPELPYPRNDVGGDGLGLQWQKDYEKWQAHQRGREVVRNHLLTSIGRDPLARTVHGWNDTPGRTKEEVLEALDRAIENAPHRELP